MELAEGSFLVVLATLVFFTITAFKDFGFTKPWLVITRGVAAVILALAALVVLL